MATTIMDQIVSISLTYQPATPVSAGLAMALLTPRGSAPISGDIASVANAAAVVALRTANGITDDGRDQLLAAYAQGVNPGIIQVVTYDGATPANVAVAAGLVETTPLDVGLLVPALATDATLEALGAWRAASTTRRYQYAIVAESRNADLLTSGKPAALDDLEQEGVRVIYGATALGSAGAAGGIHAAQPLALRPPASRLRLLGVDVYDGTGAQLAFAQANDVVCLLALDAGSGATQRLTIGNDDYSGFDAAASLSSIYIARRIRASIRALILASTIAGRDIRKDRKSANLVEGVCVEVLSSLATVGYFVGRADLPAGYRARASIVGDDVVVEVLISVPQVADIISVPITVEEV